MRRLTLLRQGPLPELLTLSLSAALLACNTTPTPLTANLAGASDIVFRCVEGEEGALRSLPLDSCGCLEAPLGAQGGRALRRLSAEECAARHPDARLIAYISSDTQGKVAVARLEAGSRQILDVDGSIPGVTHFTTGGLLSGVAMHPYGDMLIAARGSEGLLALTREHSSLRPQLNVDLGAGPLAGLAVWPSRTSPLPDEGSGSFAYLLATLEDEVLEVDLDALSLALDAALAGEAFALNGVVELSEAVTRRWRLTREEGGEAVPLSRLSVDPTGRYLTLAHADEAVVSVVDLHEPDEARAAAERREARLGALDSCADTYLSRAQDSSCAPTYEWPEGAPPACDDGVDNDGDGLVDRADPGCAQDADDDEEELRERSTCLDGLDNDADGRVDLDDDDCAPRGAEQGRPSFGEEGAAAGASPAPCLDGLDNDSDGLTDGEDPGCFDAQAAARYGFERAPQCSDGVDNDADGLVDFDAAGAGDPECDFAADKSEASDRVELSVSALLTVALELPEGVVPVAYTTTPAGAIAALSLTETPLAPRLITGAVSPLAMEVRGAGALSTLFFVSASGDLGAVHLTAPEPLLTARGEKVFARAAIASGGEGVEASAFYVVRAERAFELTALSDFVGAVPYDPRVRLPALPRAALEALAAADLDALPPLDLRDERGARGQGDPQVFVDAGRYPRFEEEWSVLRDARSQTNRAEVPVLSISGVPLNLDPARHPGLCALVGEGGERDDGLTGVSEEEEARGACRLVGDHPEGRAESDAEQEERLSSYVSSYEGVLVTEGDPSAIAAGRFALTYEGARPGSASRAGYFSSGDDRSWTLVDYERDFCALGVEPGDLWVADRFYPRDAEAAANPACEPYLRRNPNEGLSPLRYRVVSVTRRALVLERDARETYEPQLGVTPTQPAPLLAPPLAPPPFACAAQAITYEVRAGEGQWLLESEAYGYRHPWVSRGGRCVQDEARLAARRVGRARLGETYEGEWLTFRLGFRPAASGRAGVQEGALPLMVGARYEWLVSSGALTRRLSGVAVLPTALRWLPELDRLYVVDAATQSARELQGVDPYLGTMEQVQLFQ